jgi:hypothetical protein
VASTGEAVVQGLMGAAVTVRMLERICMFEMHRIKDYYNTLTA